MLSCTIIGHQWHLTIIWYCNCFLFCFEGQLHPNNHNLAGPLLVQSEEKASGEIAHKTLKNLAFTVGTVHTSAASHVSTQWLLLRSYSSTSMNRVSGRGAK